MKGHCFRILITLVSGMVFEGQTPLGGERLLFPHLSLSLARKRVDPSPTLFFPANTALCVK